MARALLFEDKKPFLEKLEELQQKGVSHNDMAVYTPYPVHEVDVLLSSPPSVVKFFTLVGGLTGIALGFGLTIFSVHTFPFWSIGPIIVGGKPFVSIPPFVIIAYELMILLGALFSFVGFLGLTRLPNIRQLISPIEYGNHFVILLEGGE